MIMSKYLWICLLIIVITSVLIWAYKADRVIVIQIVIPEGLLPYYEWLTSFPRIESTPAPPTPDQIPLYNVYYL